MENGRLKIAKGQREAFLKMKGTLEIREYKQTRTDLQNNAMHKYFDLVSEAMMELGMTMDDVIKLLEKVELYPTPVIVKEIWRAIQIALFDIKSTTKLKKSEGQIDKIHDVMNKLFGEKIGYIPFPNRNKDGNSEL